MSETMTFSDLRSRGFLSFGDGYRTKKSEHGRPGIPILRVAEVLDGVIRPELKDFVLLDFRAAMGNKTSKQGDVVLTTKGTVGRVAVIPDSFPEFVYSPQLCYFRVKSGSPISWRYLYYWFKSTEFWNQAMRSKSQTDMADYLNLADISSLKITIPDQRHQKAVTDVLGALDDKIAVNDRIVAKSRELGLILYSAALRNGRSENREVGSLVSELTRGIAPKYSESTDDLLVLNQKCVRDGRVGLSAARRTLPGKVKAAKHLRRNDVLVNSTGVGTLGRVARWTRDIEATVDSHVTIVRFDATRVDPVCAGFAMLRAQRDIELLGEGSTGQTELRRAQLGELMIELPSREQQNRLRSELDALETRSEQAIVESRTLAALRDTLLPQLMSGRLRVQDAEKLVEDAA